MTLGSDDLSGILLALALLVAFAHAFGYVFAHFRQPAVIGEILGGLLLGPTVLGVLAPGIQADVFPSEGPTAVALAVVYQLGLLLLMFCAGAEMRSLWQPGATRTVLSVAALGMVLPFIAGVLVLQVVSTGDLRGPAAHGSAFLLIFAISLAVTSIPVVSRIMFDLGILETAFARIVLAVAVLEDLVLYVVLAIALGQVGTAGSEFGLPGELGLEPGSAAAFAYHAAATVGLLGAVLTVGRRLFSWSLNQRLNVLKRRNPIAFQLVLVFALAVVCLLLGIVPLFGAFAAGIVISAGGREGARRAREAITSFSFAFFVPVYFAIVGLRLDLVHGFDPLLFVAFLVFASTVKGVSVYAGARLAREDHRSATNLSVVMNARGGPGIVVASVALDAAIIDESFFAMLVLLAVFTSLAAGTWLERALRGGLPLRSEDPAVLLEAGSSARPDRAGLRADVGDAGRPGDV